MILQTWCTELFLLPEVMQIEGELPMMFGEGDSVGEHDVEDTHQAFYRLSPFFFQRPEVTHHVAI